VRTSAPNFSPFPFDRLPHVARGEVPIRSALARWLASLGHVMTAEPRVTTHLAGLVRSTARIVSVELAARPFDPFAAIAEVRAGKLAIPIAGSSQGVRAIAQRLLGGPEELAAPRMLTPAEHAVWAAIVAAALVDLEIDATVWPLAEAAGRAIGEQLAFRSASTTIPARPGVPRATGARPPVPPPVPPVALAPGARPPPSPSHPGAPSRIVVEIGLDLGGVPLMAVASFPPELVLRPPPPRPVPGWQLELPIVVARCALPRDAVAALGVRDVIAVGERMLELVIGDGAIELTASPQALEATVATGYVPRDMALPDDAHVELTVRLGTTRMSLRRIGELAVGEVIGLGRPLAGPYDVCAGGRTIGQGELVDLDGEIGVRIVSLIEE